MAKKLAALVVAAFAAAILGGPVYTVGALDSCSNGVCESWVRTTAGFGSAVEVDSAGNVYVLATAQGDFLTIKYDSDGVELWSARYTGSEFGSQEFATAMAVDGSGNVYVTGASGYSVATVKYGSNGAQQWANNFSCSLATDLVVDSAGEVYVTGYCNGGFSGRDYGTVAYDSSGVEKWTASYDAGGDDYARAVAVDASGNVFVAGESGLVKYDGQGSQIWVKNHFSWRGQVKRAEPNQGSLDDMISLKYASDGGLQWALRLASSGYPGGGQDLVLDASGNVYVVGQRAHNFPTVKYSPAGDLVWLAEYDGGSFVGGVPLAIALDGENNVHVTGFLYHGRSDDYATVKYNSQGVLQWVAYYACTDGSDVASDVAVDESGNVYVTGFCSSFFNTFSTIKYRSDRDLDGFSDPQDNCIPTANPDQLAADQDAQGDACDTGDSDGDGLKDSSEYFCHSLADSSSSLPERIDTPGDDDGDGLVNEGLPAGATAYDCDGDGYVGSAEGNVTTSDQDRCGSGGWPSDIVSTEASANRLDLQDLGSFVAPVRRVGTSPGHPRFGARWDLVPGRVGPAINVQDIAALISGVSGYPPMFGGQRAFGRMCPYEP